MPITMYTKLLIKYFMLAVIMCAILQLMRLAINSKSGYWERMQRIRKQYQMYSKFSWVEIQQMVPISKRVDFRGTPECKQNPADVIMIGVPKCGTGSVRYSLGEHPEVAMDLNSEGVQFFSTRFHRGNLWYKSQMPCSKEGQLTVENTVQYFMDKDAPARISTFNPNMKLIITVRNPIDRLISEFVQMQVGRPEYLLGELFEENVFDGETGKVMNVSFVSKSLYSRHLKRWLQTFDISQIHVVNGDAMFDDPVSELKKIETFLGVKPYFDNSQFAFVEERGFFCFQRTGFVECLESGKGRKHPNVNLDTIDMLKTYFRPYNDEFFDLIGQDFHWND